jgi:hypothetical protein
VGACAKLNRCQVNGNSAPKDINKSLGVAEIRAICKRGIDLFCFQLLSYLSLCPVGYLILFHSSAYLCTSSLAQQVGSLKSLTSFSLSTLTLQLQDRQPAAGACSTRTAWSQKSPPCRRTRPGEALSSPARLPRRSAIPRALTTSRVVNRPLLCFSPLHMPEPLLQDPWRDGGCFSCRLFRACGGIETPFSIVWGGSYFPAANGSWAGVRLEKVI